MAGKRIAGIIASLAMIIILIISSIEIVVYINPSYFEKEYEKYDVNNQINMDMKDLLIVTAEMMSYLKDGRDDLNIVTTIDGKEREFFSQREKAHMADVKILFLKAVSLRLCAIVLAVIVLFFAIKFKWLSLLCNTFIKTSVVFLAVTLLGALLISTDFNCYFTIFHKIFFDNDLWILDPTVDLLINIVPLGFFMDTAFRIVVVFGIVLAILNIVCYLILRRKKKTGV